jgi:hypothetical protein
MISVQHTKSCDQCMIEATAILEFSFSTTLLFPAIQLNLRCVTDIRMMVKDHTQ